MDAAFGSVMQSSSNAFKRINLNQVCTSEHVRFWSRKLFNFTEVGKSDGTEFGLTNACSFSFCSIIPCGRIVLNT